MAGKNTAAFGIYHDRTAVENAVDVLKNAGYRNTDISVLFADNVGTKDFAHEKKTKAPEGATAGAGTGLVLGGALGWLQVSAPLQFRDWVRLLRRARSLERLQAPVPAEPWEV